MSRGCVIGALRRGVAGSRGARWRGASRGPCAPAGTRSGRGPRGPATPSGSTVAPAASSASRKCNEPSPAARGSPAARAARPPGVRAAGCRRSSPSSYRAANTSPRRASITGSRSGPSIPSARAAQRGHRSQLHAAGHGQRPGRGHADAQAGEGPRPHPHADRVDLAPAQPGLARAARHDAGQQLGGVTGPAVELLGVGHVLEGLAVGALHAHRGGRRGGVEAEQVHRVTVSRRRSPPRCSRRTRAATRSPAGSAIPGHSTKPIRSGVR